MNRTADFIYSIN